MDVDDKLLDEYRKDALADEPLDEELVEYNSKKYAVRQMTLDDLKKVKSLATKYDWVQRPDGVKERVAVVDETKQVALTVVFTTYIAGTDQRVYSPADVDALVKKRLSKNGLFSKLADARKRLQAEETLEEQRKN